MSSTGSYRTTSKRSKLYAEIAKLLVSTQHLPSVTREVALARVPLASPPLRILIFQVECEEGLAQLGSVNSD